MIETCFNIVDENNNNQSIIFSIFMKFHIQIIDSKNYQKINDVLN